LKVLLFATYRDIANTKMIEISGEHPNIGQLLKTLIDQFPALEYELFANQNQLKPHVHVFVNGRNIIHLNGLHTPIKQDDEIALIPPVGGG